MTQDLRDLIERELERYIEWPTADKSHVTTARAKLFAEHVARLYADHIDDYGRMSATAVHGDPDVEEPAVALERMNEG